MQMGKPNKTRQLVVRLTEEEYHLLVRASEYTSRTVSGWTRLILTASAKKQLEGVPDTPREQPVAQPAEVPASRLAPERKCPVIRAEVHDDELRTSARFDATAWFEQASDKDILDLARVDWREGEAAYAIPVFFEGYDVGTPDTVDDVFAAVNILDTGYEVTVEPEDAIRWVERNRPHLMDAIQPTLRKMNVRGSNELDGPG